MKKNKSTRLALSAVLLAPLLFTREFIRHLTYHFTGSIHEISVKGEYWFALLNILFFLAFLIPLSYRRKADWREKGLVTAFFTSMFIEMYGISFTLLFAAKYLGGSQMPQTAYKTSLLGVGLSLTHAMSYALVLMLAGGLLVVAGWVTLYRKMREGGIVTTGVYGISRHPQYLGFILIIYGWWIGWPTILTTAFAPILIIQYLKLTKKEEKEMGKDGEYAKYLRETPWLI